MKNYLRVGLFFGILMGLCHLGWVILVWTGVAKRLYDWILSLHFVNLTYAIADFQLVTALSLVAFTFAVGFAGGFILTALWHWVVGRK